MNHKSSQTVYIYIYGSPLMQSFVFIRLTPIFEKRPVMQEHKLYVRSQITSSAWDHRTQALREITETCNVFMDRYTQNVKKHKMRFIFIFNKFNPLLPDDALRHHPVNSVWCLEASPSEFCMMPWGITQWIPDDASKHHPVNSEWCLEASPSEFRMMPRSITQWIPDDALRHHLVTTR